MPLDENDQASNAYDSGAFKQNIDVPTDQDQEEQKLVKHINMLLQRSKRHRKRYDSDWHFNYEFVCSGRQWSTDRPRWRFAEVTNIIWSTIMTELALQTDSRPKFDLAAADSSDIPFVDTLSEVLGVSWDKYKWSGVLCDALFDCKLYHVAHGEVGWDERLAEGLGDIDFKVMDPFYCFVDPRASDVNKGRMARWFIYNEPRPTAELKLSYPEKKDKIKSDVAMMSGKTEQPNNAPGRTYTNFDPYSPSRLPSSSTGSGELYGGEPHTVLIRAWLRDDTMEEVVEEKQGDTANEEDLQKEYVLRKKYPNGRYVEIANNTVLRDVAPGVSIQGEWVPYTEDCFPIAKLVNYSYPREYYGENELTHTKGPQKIVNYIWSYILDMFRMQSNPVTILGTGANVDEEEITNEPGMIIHADDVNAVRREPGTPIAGGAMELLGMSQQLLDKVQGIKEIQRGEQIPGATSGIMLDGYMEAAQTRPRFKNRNLDLFLQDVGQLMVYRMLQFYTQPRIFRLTNKDGYPQAVELYMPTIEDHNGKLIKVAHMTQISTVDGQPVRGPTQTVDIKGVPDIRVTSGSALPFAKIQKSDKAMQYFQAGVIDREELLKQVDWPNYEDVMKRMDQAAAQNAQGKQQMMQQQTQTNIQTQEAIANAKAKADAEADIAVIQAKEASEKQTAFELEHAKARAGVVL